jgi:hypothetical protein
MSASRKDCTVATTGAAMPARQMIALVAGAGRARRIGYDIVEASSPEPAPSSPGSNQEKTAVPTYSDNTSAPISAMARKPAATARTRPRLRHPVAGRVDRGSGGTGEPPPEVIPIHCHPKALARSTGGIGGNKVAKRGGPPNAGGPPNGRSGGTAGAESCAVGRR